MDLNGFRQAYFNTIWHLCLFVFVVVCLFECGTKSTNRWSHAVGWPTLFIETPRCVYVYWLKRFIRSTSCQSSSFLLSVLYLLSTLSYFRCYVDYIGYSGQVGHRNGQAEPGGSGSQVRLRRSLPQRSSELVATYQTKDMVSFRRALLFQFSQGLPSILHNYNKLIF